MTVRPDPQWDSEPATSRPAEGRLHRPDGTSAGLVWQLPEEVPVAIMHNSVSTAVMMATPADLEDFAVGFSLSEGFVTDAAAIRNVVTLTVENGFCVDIAVDEASLKPRSARALEGRTGCGLLVSRTSPMSSSRRRRSIRPLPSIPFPSRRSSPICRPCNR
jgi:FdhD protein